MSNQQDKSCYVGNYHQIEREAIRETVCRDLSVENDGYCLLHSPRLDKDQQEFERFFGERISQNRSHFEAVVFPIPIDLNHCAFSLPLNFMRATFLSSVTFYKMRIKYVSFDYARFQGLAQFHRSSFDEVATFTGATFCREARFTGSYFKASKFDHVTFSGPTQFNSGAKFFEAADFSSTKFVGKTDFDTATFESSVSFDEAEFDTGSQVSFFMSSFRNEASFKKAIFRGYISFDGVNSHEVFGNGSTLSLRKARLEASEEVAFHSVRLRPHWFVDTDSRRFVFTNLPISNGKVKMEERFALKMRSQALKIETLLLTARHLLHIGFYQ